jgi:hypothetical protein
MSKLLLAANVLLVAASLGLGAYIVREAAVPLRKPLAAKPRAGAAPSTPAPAGATAEPARGASPSSYAVVASRNLFSPTRSEAPAAPPAAVAARAMLPKPNLFGVVLGDGASVAYLEDPATKRVAGYRLGDAIAGGTVQTIGPDRVVLARPDGAVDIRLHDPTRPRPAVPQPGAPVPGVPPRPGIGNAPGVAPPLSGGNPAEQSEGIPPGAPVPPGVHPTPQPPVAPRRPLPPNLEQRLRRFGASPPASDAPAQPR